MAQGNGRPGGAAVIPHLIIRGAARAIDWYKQAFGATGDCVMQMPGSDKVMHAEIRINGSPVMIADEFPEWGSHSPQSLNGSPVTIHLYVPDVDSVFARAVELGAKAEMPVQDMFWGDRYGKLIDPFGHHWSVATHVRDVPAEEMMRAAQEAMAGAGG
ncbi:MAG TPA: VOC family protein [Gemmataceae bacterium]